MAVEFTPHSEPEDASDSAREHMARHSIVMDRAPAPALSTEEVLKDLDERVKAEVEKHENVPMDANRIEHLRRNLSALPNVASVAVSAVEDMAEVAVRALVAGVESWIKAKFSTLPVPNVVDEPSNEMASAMRGKGPSGDDKHATDPYAENPTEEKKTEQRKPD